MNLISKPVLLFATKAETEAARTVSDPELARAYIEHLEAIAEAALELEKYDYDMLEDIDWEPLRNALGKVYIL